MTTKLTLRMDEHLIEVAKRHAAAHDTSVSRMVAAYFAALAAGADAIVTRDRSRFASAALPVFTPAAYLAAIRGAADADGL